MLTWVLIIFVHVGAMGDGNSNAITSVPGFTVREECEAAGAVVKKLSTGTVKDIRTVCIGQTRPK